MRFAHRYAGRAADAEGALGARLWDLGARAVELDGADLVAYFEQRTEVPDGGTWVTIAGIDHVAAYLEGLEAVDVGSLVVAPTHRAVTLRAPQKVVWFDPGMAFGTGHHETTRLALRALGLRDIRGARVLDVGSGSGILAIAAAVLGAAEAIGVDVDHETLEEARANAARNRVHVRFELLDAEGLVDEPAPRPAAPSPAGPSLPAPREVARGGFDLVVANLYAELHARLMPAYARLVRPGGTLLLSGILADRRGAVTAAVAAPLALRSEAQEGDWQLLELGRAGGGP